MTINEAGFEVGLVVFILGSAAQETRNALANLLYDWNEVTS